MARTFDGVDDVLEFTTAPVAVYPLTLAAWYRPSVVNTNGTVLGLGSNTAADNQYQALGVNPSGIVFIESQATGGGAAGTGTAGATLVAGSWFHLAGVVASATSRTAYRNGVAGTANTTSKVSTGLNRITVGGLRTAQALASFRSGMIAECAAWNVALTAAQIAALARGVSPRLIRPAALVFYAPIWGTGSPEPDYTVGQRKLTVTGATLADRHPPVQPFPMGDVWTPQKIVGGAPTTEVVVALTSTWDAAGEAVAARTSTWDTVGETVAARTTSWATLTEIERARSSTWETAAEAAAARTSSWLVNGEAVAARTSSWDVQGETTLARTSPWDVAAEITTPRSTSWDVLEAATEVVVARTTSWDVTSETVTARSTTWATLGEATLARATQWDLAGELAAARSSSWATLGEAAVPRTTVWSVAAEAAAARSSAWDLAGEVAAPRSTTWATNGTATSPLTTTWDTAGSGPATVERTLSSSWELSGEASAARTSTWALDGTLEVLRSSQWALLTTSETPLATRWDTAGEVALSRATAWDTAGETVAPWSSLWATLAVVERPPAKTGRVLNPGNGGQVAGAAAARPSLLPANTGRAI